LLAKSWRVSVDKKAVKIPFPLVEKSTHNQYNKPTGCGGLCFAYARYSSRPLLLLLTLGFLCFRLCCFCLFCIGLAVSNDIFSIPVEQDKSPPSEQLDLFARAPKPDDSRGLEEFVFGEENAVLELALTSILQQTFLDSPLVLYGDAGTGKSFLGHALSTQWSRQHPLLKSHLTTGVDLAREHARAVYSRSLDEFRDKHHLLDLLVVDDIQLLSTRSSSQEALCLIIDSFKKYGGQLVFCCDRLPMEVDGFDDRLTSRLMGGLQIKLSPPGKGVRGVIVDRLSGAHGVTLDEATRETLVAGAGFAGSKLETVPEIRSALLRLRTKAELESRDISQSDVSQLISDNAASQQPGLRDIAVAVGKCLNIRLSDMKSSSRRRYVVRARGIAIYLCRVHTGKSYREIGQYFGRRDHSTIMHAFKKTEASLSTDHSIQLIVKDVRGRLAVQYRL